MNISFNLQPQIYNYQTTKQTVNTKPMLSSQPERDVFVRQNSNAVSFGHSQGISKSLKRIRKHHDDLLQHMNMPVEKWLKQFDSNKDRSIALKILSSFEYISQEKARSIFARMHKQLLERPDFDINKTAFTYMGEAKSGAVMGYYYSQAAKFREKGPAYKGNDLNQRMFSMSKLEKMGVFDKDSEVNTLVIVDDMIDNGNSIQEFLSPKFAEQLKSMDKVYFITLLANPEGVAKIKQQIPNIEFITHKEIHKYDSPKCTRFSKKDKHEIREFIHKYSKKIEPKEVNKFKDSKIFVTFDWNTPGNTPMPFCYSKPGVWEPLFKRYNGLM